MTASCSLTLSSSNRLSICCSSTMRAPGPGSSNNGAWTGCHLPADWASASRMASAFASRSSRSRLTLIASLLRRKRSSCASTALVETVAKAMISKARRAGVNGPPVFLVFHAGSMAQQQFFTAATTRHQTQTDLHLANIRLRRGAGVCAVHYHLAAATQCPPGGSRHNGNRSIFKQLVDLLESVDRPFQHLPFALLSSHQHQEDIRARREVCRFITDDQRAKLLFAFLDDIAQHLNDTLVDGVHLRMKLDTGYIVAQIDQRGRAIIAQDVSPGLCRRQRDGALRYGNRPVRARIEIEVRTLPKRAGIKRALAPGCNTPYQLW